MLSSLYNPLNYLFIIVVDSDYNLHYILICFNYLWIFWITFHPYVCFARSDCRHSREPLHRCIVETILAM